MTIDRLEQMNIDPDVKEQCLAEMHCARGWLAFCLYDFFGPVPLVDVETLKTRWKKNRPSRYRRGDERIHCKRIDPSFQCLAL